MILLFGVMSQNNNGHEYCAQLRLMVSFTTSLASSAGDRTRNLNSACQQSYQGRSDKRVAGTRARMEEVQDGYVGWFKLVTSETALILEGTRTGIHKIKCMRFTRIISAILLCLFLHVPSDGIIQEVGSRAISSTRQPILHPQQHRSGN